MGTSLTFFTRYIKNKYFISRTSRFLRLCCRPTTLANI